MYILLRYTALSVATQLGPGGDARNRGILTVIFKIPKCTSHLGIGLGESCGHATFYPRSPQHENTTGLGCGTKGRLHDTPGVGKEAGQATFRLTKTNNATSGAAWAWATSSPLSRRRAQVEQHRAVVPFAEHPDPGRTGRHRTAVRRSGDHSGALDVPTRMWGGGQPAGGARGPQPPIRPTPSGCCAATDSLSGADQ